jgi:hypothetical protein
MRSSMSSLARRRKGANEVDHAKSAINLVINTRSDDTQKAAVSDSVLSQRLNNLDVSYLFGASLLFAQIQFLTIFLLKRT